jgi:hypothetical protein
MLWEFRCCMVEHKVPRVRSGRQFAGSTHRKGSPVVVAAVRSIASVSDSMFGYESAAYNIKTLSSRAKPSDLGLPYCS